MGSWRDVLVVPLCALLLVVLSVSGDVQTGSYLRDANNVQNKEHIREHMSEYYNEGDMEEQVDLESEEATRFHYFKLHDYNNDNKLDGLELYNAIAHFAEEHHNEAGADEGAEGEKHHGPILEHEQITKLVDTVLKQDDLNEDGFVDYYEFVQAQQGAPDDNV